MKEVNVYQVISDCRFNRFHLRVTILGILVFFMEGYGLSSLGATTPLMIESGIDAITLGSIGSYGLYGMFIGAILGGSLADKIGKKKVLIIALFVYSIANGCICFIHTALPIMFLRIIACVAFSMVVPTMFALIAEYSSNTTRATQVALINMGAQTGFLFSQFIAYLFMLKMGWGFVYKISFLGIILIPFIIFLMPESMEHLIGSGASKQSFKKVQKILQCANPSFNPTESDLYITGRLQTEEKIRPLDLFKRPMAKTTLLLCLFAASSLMMAFAFSQWISQLMVEIGYTISQSLIFAIVYAIGCILGSIILGRVIDRLGYRRTIILTSILGLGLSYLLGHDLSFGLRMLIVLLVGSAVGGMTSILFAFLSIKYPSNIRGTGVGLSSAIGRLGGSIGPQLGGYLIASGTDFQNICMIFSIPFVLCILVVVLLGKKNSESVNS